MSINTIRGKLGNVLRALTSIRKRHSRLTHALVLCLAVLPAVLHGWVVLRYSVNVPFKDDWYMIPMLEEFARGTLSFDDLFAPVNQSRTFFPNLAFVAVAYFTNFDVRYLMLVSFLLACLISFNVYYLGKQTISGSSLKRLLLFFCSTLLIFAPIQTVNWLWGIQIVYWVPIACITTCLALLYSGLGTRTKFFACIILATISTFSYANGMLIWILIFPAIAWSRTWDELFRKRWLVLGWAVGFALNVAIFFYDYTRYSLNSALSEILIQPVQVLQFFLAFLGSPYSQGFHALVGSPSGTSPYSQGLHAQVVSASGTLELATVLGTLLLLLFMLFCVYFLTSLRDFALIRRAIPWLMIGAYSTISGTAVATGRVGNFGVEQSLAERYATFSLYFVVSLIYLSTIIFSNVVRGGNPLLRRPFITVSGTFLIATVMLFHSLTSLYWVAHYVPRIGLQHSNAKTCVLLINVVSDSCVQGMWILVEDLRERAPIADDLGLLTPGLLKSDKIQDVEGAESGAADYGNFDAFTKNGERSYLTTGFAVLPEKKKPADGVLLTYEEADGEPIVFAVADTGTVRGDVAEEFDNNAYILSGWEESFRVAKLPSGSTKIDAWAFDAEAGTAYKLDKTHAPEQLRYGPKVPH